MLRFSVLERLWQKSSDGRRRLWRRPAAPRPIRLLSVHEVAEVHKEPGIIGGYVPHGSLWLCLRGLFLPTNETINFWTHFLAALYFAWQLSALWRSLDIGDTYNWPFLCYMLTTCVYPLVSCVAHALSSMSVKAAHYGFFVDYAAVSLFGYGVGLLYRSYCFPDSWDRSGYGRFFMCICFVNTVVCTFFACRSRFMPRCPRQKVIRVLAFLMPYAWDHVPLLYRLWTCGAADASCQASAGFHLRQLIASVLGSLLYGTHLPELLSPGTFDVIGHSHNFLHVLGIHATNEQMKGALLDLQLRRVELAAAPDVTLASWATWGCALVAIINMVIVAGAVTAMSRHIDREATKNR